MNIFIERLKADKRGRILLVQLANAIRDANRIKDVGLVEKLKKFIRECEGQVLNERIEKDEDDAIDPDKSFFRPIIVPSQDDYLHRDPANVDLEARLVTVITLHALTDHLLKPGILRQDHPTATIQATLRALNDKGFEDSFKPEARVGAKFSPATNHFWATRYEAAVQVAPSLGRTEIIPRDEAERLRNFLGLGHLAKDIRLAVLIFDGDSLQRHAVEEAAKITRPFIFEGVGNHRFLLTDRASEGGWNHALDLEVILDPTRTAKGGPEIVLSSISCDEVRRVCVSEGLPNSPCVNREEDILRIMLNKDKLDDALAVVAGLMQGETEASLG